jgi:predicted metal-dependent phosphotriesterase family hydrolase
VVEVMLPYLTRIRSLGCRTLVDCTATYAGRDPRLLKRLSDASGLQILTVTGNYASNDGRFLPPYVFSDSVDSLARRWIAEWIDGIDGSGIRPGLVKLGFNGGPLTDVERKLIRAAAITRKATGLAIGAHVGPWRDVKPGENAASAFQQIAELEKAGVEPSSWIWIHAQNEKDAASRVRAARRGAWISLDGFRPAAVQDYVEMVKALRREGLLGHVLLSQDAGWYTPGKPRGGDITPYDPIFTSLVPALEAAGFSKREIDTLFIDNPSAAFSTRPLSRMGTRSSSSPHL